MVIEDALQAIEARKQGEWDNPTLVALGPLGFEDDDILAIKTRCLQDYGYRVGSRDPRLNTNYPGKFMVAEYYETDELPTEDGRNGPWCIVGDNLNNLIEEAFNVLVSFEKMEN